ncbi:MAG: hypothetical protein JRI25_18320 [Deltaproteobacteria bacterium]|nr:hypothetical protein [Deltaproteobacteria bacterium]
MRWFQVLLTAAWLLGGGLALADEPSDAPIEVLDLITEEEAAQPDAPPTRGPVVDLTDGPVIRVESALSGASRVPPG